VQVGEKNPPIAQGDLQMKSHIEGEVKWVLFLTSITIFLIVTGLVTTGF
jgi:hypothetical protein